MNIRAIVFMLIVIGTPAWAKNCDYNDNYQYTPQAQPSFFKERYINTILPGALVGSAIGLLCAMIDHRVPNFWPVTWLLLGIEREVIIKGLSDYAPDDVHHHHKAAVMSSTSWLAAWISYLIAGDYLHHRYRF